MINLTVNDLKKELPFDIVELISKNVYNNRLQIIKIKKYVFYKWKNYKKLYKLNKFINFVLYNDIDNNSMPNLNNNYIDINLII